MTTHSVDVGPEVSFFKGEGAELTLEAIGESFYGEIKEYVREEDKPEQYSLTSNIRNPDMKRQNPS